MILTKITDTELLYLEQKRQEIDRLLDRYLPGEDVYPQTLHKAMRYSVLAGGKRIRPILTLTAYEVFGGSNPDLINPAVCSLEFVHTYSLIHDDLPCMDDDDLRRGLPTLHKKFDETTAVLAGDALHDLAFRLLAESNSARAVLELAKAIGTFGMLGGQMADVEAEGTDVTLEQIKFIHSHKTGALICAAVRIGAILAEVDEATLEKLSLYGEKIGLAFQIVDDILDVEGDKEKLGKNIGSDRKNQKATYPKVIGLNQSHQDVDRLIDEAVAISREFGLKDNRFITIAHFIGQRDK
ncbi:MAG: polyprenyl synthetase family protein [candidate division Zixibacteria bacterium]|nr:polyprenyl synthetase family protein [candidate division Zixibacteria bacterium]